MTLERELNSQGTNNRKCGALGGLPTPAAAGLAITGSVASLIGDVLLVERVDRLSRLTAEDWEWLKTELTARRARVVLLDLPTSRMMATSTADEFTDRMFEAINGTLLDVLPGRDER